MQRITIILMTLILFSCNSKKEVSIPKWINTSSNSDEIFGAVGIAESKKESIMNALTQLAGLIETNIKTEERDTCYILSSSSEKAFGKVTINASHEHYREEVEIGDSTEISGNFELFGELTFSDGNKQLLYNDKYSETFNGIDRSFSHHFDITEINCTLKDLIDELNSVGCEFDFYSDNEHIYTLVRYEKRRLHKNIGILMSEW